MDSLITDFLCPLKRGLNEDVEEDTEDKKEKTKKDAKEDTEEEEEEEEEDDDDDEKDEKENRKEKKVINFIDYYIYEPEIRQIFAAELSPCSKFFCICDSLSNAYIYAIKNYHFLYLFKLTSYYKSPTTSIIWITKKNKKEHIYMHNEFADYLLGFAFLNGTILFYDLANKCVVEKITCNSSITKCRINNSLEFLGFTDLSGSFHYYSIYKNETDIIQNCYETFFSEKHQQRNQKEKEMDMDMEMECILYRTKRKWDDTFKQKNVVINGDQKKNMNSLENYTSMLEKVPEGKQHEEDEQMLDVDYEDEDEDEDENENEKADDVIKFSKLEKEVKSGNKHKGKEKKMFEKEEEEEEKKEEEVFSFAEKLRFSCSEKLICFYFMDVLKHLDDLIFENKLLEIWDSLKKTYENRKKSKKKKKGNSNDGTGYGDGYDEKEQKGWNEEKVQKKLNKKITKIQRCYNNYKHYVLLGTDKSKIYKYCLRRKECVGIFRSVHKDTIIWDVVYIYRTNEVACVDNKGSLVIFDNDTKSVKYHIQSHMYKAISITKGFNERYIYTAGVDRYIKKYSLQNLVNAIPEERSSFHSYKSSHENVYSDYRSDQVTFASLIQSNKHQTLHKKFYIYDHYVEKNMRRNWIFFSKYASHRSDIKKIINLNDKYIISVSDDYSFCVNDTLSYKKFYYYLVNTPDHKRIHFSENLEVMLCRYSNNIKIYQRIKDKYDNLLDNLKRKKYNNEEALNYIKEQFFGKESETTTTEQEEEKEKEKEKKKKRIRKQADIEQSPLMINDAVRNAKAYEHKASIYCKKNEHIDIIRFNNNATIIGCLTNRQFSLYSCKLHEASIYNFDLTKLGICKVFDFCFINEKVVLISVMKMEDLSDKMTMEGKRHKKNVRPEVVKANKNGLINVTEFFANKNKPNETEIYGQRGVNDWNKDKQTNIEEYVKHFGGQDMVLNEDEYENEEWDKEEKEKRKHYDNLDAQLMHYQVRENMNYLKTQFGFYLVVYNIKKKKIVEERKMNTYVRNFTFSKRGVIVCSDNYKNIYVLFQTSDHKYLKRVRALKNFNVNEENLEKVIMFYLVVENTLFLFGAWNAVYIFKLDIGRKTVRFDQKLYVRQNFAFCQFQELCLFNLGTKKNGETERQMLKIEIQEKQKGQKEKGEKQKEKETLDVLGNYYCLICKRHDRICIFDVNINAHKKEKGHINLFFNVDNVDTSKKVTVQVNLLDQLYYNGLGKTETFYLNKKQKFLRDITFFSQLKKALKSGTSEKLKHIVKYKIHEGLQENYETREKKSIMQFKKNSEFCFNSLFKLLLQYTIDVVCGHDDHGNLYVLVCVPKTTQDIIMPVANTKKYRN